MSLIDSLPSAIFSLRIDQKGTLEFLYANVAFTRLASLTSAELQRDADLFFRKIIAPRNIKMLIEAAITQQQPFTTEFELLQPKSESKWMQLALAPALDAEHNTLGNGVIADITESHNEKIKAIESAQFFMHMQDQLQDLFYFKDRKSRFLGGNKAFYEYHGETSMDALIGKSDLDSRLLAGDAGLERYAKEQDLMENGGIIRNREHVATLDGRNGYYESIKTPLYDDNGEAIGMVGLTRDITAQVEAETALEKAREEAEHAAKAKSSFLAVMSHEIRTPMNGVIGCASLLGSTPLSSEQQQLVGTIQSCGESLLVLINDILDYSKIEAGKINLEKSPFQMRLLIEDCIELFSKQVSEKNLEINYFIEADVPHTLNGDATRIRQIINNLVGNAIKFTTHGEVFVDVSITKLDKTTQQCGLLITVRDTGIGIAQDSQSNLFNAFTQADSSITRKFGGTGLGLVICKKIVAQMEGDIWFKSTPGQGTTFFATITLGYDPLDTTPKNVVPLESLRGLRVLIVDDNATNRKVLANTIMQWGMIPAAFDSPQNTLENLHFGHEYDLVLLDFCMPKTNGSELAGEIRKLPQMYNKPIIILSSAMSHNNEMKHINACLQKPVRNSVLQKTIAHVMGEVSTQDPNTLRTVEPYTVKQTRILVVEDNTVNQMVIAMMLKKLGYTNFSCVADGEEAVEQCASIVFDIIFMDIQMVRMDGYTAAKLIRQQTKNPTIPWIIALTAGAQKEDSERAFASGMNAFTTKPIQLEGLKAVLANAENSMSL